MAVGGTGREEERAGGTDWEGGRVSWREGGREGWCKGQGGRKRGLEGGSGRE